MVVLFGKHNTIYEVSKRRLGDLSQKGKIRQREKSVGLVCFALGFWLYEERRFVCAIIKKNALKKIIHPRAFLTPVKHWRKVYSDAENPELFKQWLEMLLSSRRKDVISFGDAHVPRYNGIYDL